MVFSWDSWVLWVLCNAAVAVLNGDWVVSLESLGRACAWDSLSSLLCVVSFLVSDVLVCDSCGVFVVWEFFGVFGVCTSVGRSGVESLWGCGVCESCASVSVGLCAVCVWSWGGVICGDWGSLSLCFLGVGDGSSCPLFCNSWVFGVWESWVFGFCIFGSFTFVCFTCFVCAVFVSTIALLASLGFFPPLGVRSVLGCASRGLDLALSG